MKICLVSNAILGADLPGGVATATSHLALLLAESGHAVTLFYVGEKPLDGRTDWASHYQRAAIDVRHYVLSKARLQPRWMKMPVEIYEQLKDQDFDIVLFQGWMALGHASVVAKRAGMGFHRTVLATWTPANTAWLLEANAAFPHAPEQLAIMGMEQQQVELSDAVVSPSKYIQDWMLRANWKLPAAREVIPYFLNGLELLGSAPERERSRDAASESKHVIFYGRLEQRKGIELFLAALASAELRDQEFRMTFLGHPDHKSPTEIRDFIAANRPDLVNGLVFNTTLTSDEAQAFLAENDCVAVIPSIVDNSPCVIYEALKLGVPFIASAAGGIPELIDERDRERVLFRPTPRDLALKLKQVLGASGWPAARPSFEPSEVGRRWLAWFDERSAAPRRPARVFSGGGSVDVTIVVTHHERPKLLLQNLLALSLQTDRSFRVVLVDDGSTSEAARRFLDRAERGIGGLPVEIVRQQNKYLGAARNEGLRHVDTEHVIFLDDDNIAFPNMVEVFRRAARFTKADIITCQMQIFRDPLGEPDPYMLCDGERWAFPGGPAALGILRNCFGDATGIYRRELFDDIGYFHETFGVGHEDWQLHLRACLEGHTLISIPQALFWYRIAPGSMVRTNSAYDNLRVITAEIQKRIPAGLASAIDLLMSSR